VDDRLQQRGDRERERQEAKRRTRHVRHAVIHKGKSCRRTRRRFRPNLSRLDASLAGALQTLRRRLSRFVRKAQVRALRVEMRWKRSSVGLAERESHFPAQLSGGEQQRVAIARAVVKRPDILLCDEPTGALDFRTGRLVLGVLAKVNRELGTTTAIITHNATIAAMADRVVTLSQGTVKSVEQNARRKSAEEIEW